MSMVWANMSDAITDSYNRTKDLFTLRCSSVAMVLDYDVTIKGLGFLIERMDGGWMCLCVRACVLAVCACCGNQFIWKSDMLPNWLCVSRLRTQCWFTHKREIRYICAPETHTYTPTESELLKEIHWFSCCYAAASITIKHHYCADHFA